jgi:hypothetical protein
MTRPRYPTGEEICSGDRIVFQGAQARVLFVKQVNDYVAKLSPSDWDFLPDDTIGLEFEDGRSMHYSGFCHHDGIILLSRSGAA